MFKNDVLGKWSSSTLMILLITINICGSPIFSVLFPIRNRSLSVRQADRCSTVQCNAGQSVVMFRNTAGVCRNWTILLASSGVKGFEAILHKNNDNNNKMRIIKMSGFCRIQHKWITHTVIFPINCRSFTWNHSDEHTFKSLKCITKSNQLLSDNYQYNWQLQKHIVNACAASAQTKCKFTADIKILESTHM